MLVIILLLFQEHGLDPYQERTSSYIYNVKQNYNESLIKNQLKRYADMSGIMTSNSNIFPFVDKNSLFYEKPFHKCHFHKYNQA